MGSDDYSEVLKKSVLSMVEPQILEEYCRSWTSLGTLDQLFTPAGYLDGALEFIQSVYGMCFVNMEKHVPQGTLSGES